jgi:hypothetical protein
MYAGIAAKRETRTARKGRLDSPRLKPYMPTYTSGKDSKKE